MAKATMKLSHVKRLVLEPMTALWSPPFGVDATRAQAEYDQGLCDLNEPALRYAMERLRREHDGPNWPSVFTIRKLALGWVERDASAPTESLAAFTFRRGPELEKGFRFGHPALYEQAQREGWLLDINHAVAERALAVAQHEYAGNRDTSIRVIDDDIAKFQHRVRSRNAQYERTKNLPNVKGDGGRFAAILKRAGLVP